MHIGLASYSKCHSVFRLSVYSFVYSIRCVLVVSPFTFECFVPIGVWVGYISSKHGVIAATYSRVEWNRVYKHQRAMRTARSQYSAQFVWIYYHFNRFVPLDSIRSFCSWNVTLTHSSPWSTSINSHNGTLDCQVIWVGFDEIAQIQTYLYAYLWDNRVAEIEWQKN